MMVRWNLEQEGHDLVDVDNLDWLAGEAGLEVGAPGEADSLHLVRKLVVEGDLLGLPGAHLLLLVLGSAGDDVWRRRLWVVTTLSQVIAGGRKEDELMVRTFEFRIFRMDPVRATKVLNSWGRLT